MTILNTTHLRLALASGLAVSALTLGGCGASSGGNAPAPHTVANVAANVLQFAVGTANIHGTAGLNVAVTYRQPAGATDPGGSGALVSSPTLTIPGTLPATAGSPGADPTSTIATGPGPGEVGGHSLTPTSQSPTATTVTSFGQSGGAFGLGLEPFNYTLNGLPGFTNPYPVPLYDALAGDPNQLPAAWGDVPAFDLLGTGQAPNGSPIVPSGTAGVSEGLDVFELAPVLGTYSLTIAVPGNNGTVTQTKSARLGSAALLPALAAPTAFTPDGNGGASFAVTLPAGIPEAYLEIADVGPSPAAPSQPASANGASVGSPVFYTFVVRASGKYTLGDNAGPGGAPSISTVAQNTAANGTTTDGDSVQAWVFGFDYPLYEASYPNSLGNPTPAITGKNGQADISISPAGAFSQPANGGSAVAVPAISIREKPLRKR